MHQPSRRAVLAGVATATLPLSAGCLSEDDVGLHAVDQQVVYGGGYPELDDPAQVGVRVTVENDAKQRLEGILVVELERLAADGDGESVEDSWQQERRISLTSLVTEGYTFVFDGANPPGEDDPEYRVEMRLEDVSPAE